MDWSNSFVYITTISGIAFFACGIILLKFPPKKINDIYGYRSLSSMKSQYRWDFAQVYSAKELVRWGLVMIATGFAASLVEIHGARGTMAGIAVLILFSAILIIRTEMAIKKKFGNL